MMTVKINGQEYTRWKTVSVTRAVSEFCPYFSISSNDAQASTGTVIDIAPMDDVQIYADSELIFTGFVETIDIEQEASATSVTYGGRSRTCDVLDCSAFVSGFRIANAKPSRIVEKLCAQVSVDVVVEADGDLIADFAMLPGDSIYECLLRACNPAGIQLITNERGQIVMKKGIQSQRPSYAISAATKSIISRTRSIDYASRYSEIRMISQLGGSGGIGEQDSAKFISRSAFDSDVIRSRLLIDSAEDQISSKLVERRARYERNRRVGASDSITYTSSSFSIDRIKLIAPFDCISVSDKFARATSLYAVDIVVFSESYDSGTLCTFTLVPPQAFSFEPVKQKRKTGTTKGVSNQLIERINRRVEELAKQQEASEK